MYPSSSARRESLILFVWARNRDALTHSLIFTLHVVFFVAVCFCVCHRRCCERIEIFAAISPAITVNRTLHFSSTLFLLFIFFISHAASGGDMRISHCAQCAHCLWRPLAHLHYNIVHSFVVVFYAIHTWITVWDFFCLFSFSSSVAVVFNGVHSTKLQIFV